MSNFVLDVAIRIALAFSDIKSTLNPSAVFYPQNLITFNYIETQRPAFITNHDVFPNFTKNTQIGELNELPLDKITVTLQEFEVATKVASKLLKRSVYITAIQNNSNFFGFYEMINPKIILASAKKGVKTPTFRPDTTSIRQSLKTPSHAQEHGPKNEVQKEIEVDKKPELENKASSPNFLQRNTGNIIFALAVLVIILVCKEKGIELKDPNQVTRKFEFEPELFGDIKLNDFCYKVVDKISEIFPDVAQKFSNIDETKPFWKNICPSEDNSTLWSSRVLMAFAKQFKDYLINERQVTILVPEFVQFIRNLIL